MVDSNTKKKIEFLNRIPDSLVHPFCVIDANNYTIKKFSNIGINSDLSQATTCYELEYGRSKPCDDSDHVCPLREIKKTKQPVVVWQTHRDRDGNTRDIKVHAYPILNDSGDVEEIIECFQDITKHKQAGAKLEEANAIINRSSSVAFTWKNMKGWPVEFVTENVEKVFGYTAQDFISGTISYDKCIHPDDLKRVNREVEAAGQEAGRVDFAHEPYRILTRDGSCRIVKDWTFMVRDKQGNITHYKGLVEDITELQQTIKSQKLKDEEINIILNSVPAFIFYKDRDNRFIRVNKSMTDVTGLSREQIEGKTVFELFPENAEQYWQDDLEVINSGIPKRNIIEPMVVGDNTLWVQTDKIPYRDSSGNIVGIIGFSQDITERKRIEKALQRKSHDLSERIKELNCLSSVLQIEMDTNLSLDETIQSIVDIIPQSWQYPEITRSRIVVSKRIYTTDNFAESERCQSAIITVSGKIKGKIEVFYTEERPEIDDGSFQAEERELINTLAATIGLYLERKRIEADLHASNLQLIAESQALQEANTTLKGVLARIETEKKDNLLSVQSHVDRVVMPLLRQLKNSANDIQTNYITLIEDNLSSVTSPFVSELESLFTHLSPREVEISKYVKDGLSSKDIASLFNTSEGTVRNQRKSIRRKLGISSDKVSLTSFLRGI
ncbi:MAG: PAS domain S-box protein [candidate division Zixibacteria bacterium]|nr:PAS domain S-box protein [candidate division Zixibacteria bacterium]